jgi:hypothetical protein
MEELVAGWWEYARLPQWSRGRAQAPRDWRRVFDAGRYGLGARIRRGGEDSLQVVAALLERAPDEDGGALVAAGHSRTC